MVSAANKLPSILTPDVLKKNVQDDEDDKSVQCQSAQAKLSESEVRQAEIDSEECSRRLTYWGQQTGIQLNNKEA